MDNQTSAVAQYLNSTGQWKLCDLEKMPILGTNPVQYIPTSGIVTWKSANRRNYIRNVKYGHTFHAKSGTVYGAPLKFDPKTGDINWLPVFIEGELILDLSDTRQRLQHFLLWHDAAHKNGPCFHGLEHTNMTTPLIVVDDPEATASQALEKRKTVKTIERIVDDMTDFGRMQFAANMGIDVRRNSKTVYENMLYEKIANDPIESLKRYNDPRREIWEIFNLSVQCNVVMYKSGGYYYGSTLMGTDKRMAVQWLSDGDNGSVLSAIKSQVDEALGIKIAGVSTKKDTGSSGSSGTGTGNGSSETKPGLF
jgi:hypothetical protein